MRKIICTAISGMICTSAALSGCGGSSENSSPSAQIRAVDVAVNTVDSTKNNQDTGSVLINGANIGSGQYGVPTEYRPFPTEHVQFQAKTTLPLPVKQTAGSDIATTITPIVSTMNLTPGQRYTAFLTGQRDIIDPSGQIYDGPAVDYFSFLNIFVLADDQPAPPPGQATVRVLVAGAMGVVNVAVNGSVPVAFQNLYYSTPNVPYPGGFSPPAGTASVSSNIFLGAGTVSIQVDDLISNQPIIPTTPITLAAGAKYTLVVTKPTSAPYINNSPVVPPVTTTYALKLVKN